MKYYALFLLLFVEQAIADNTQVWKNPDCITNKSCPLVEFGVTDIDSFHDFGTGPSKGTYMKAWWKTKNISQLTNYGIVQFIKGCLYQKGANGEINFSSREFFGESLTDFNHPEWEIDSIDSDPLYQSYFAIHNDPELKDYILKTHGQEYLDKYIRYITHKVPNSLSDKNTDDMKQIYQVKPKYPVIFVTDHPSTSFYGIYKYADKISISETVSSMIFKTCLYEIEQIPLQTSSKSMRPEDAIVCFEWSNNWLYDNSNNSFVNNGMKLDQNCTH